MLNLDFSEKGLGIVSPPDFVKKNVPYVIFYQMIEFPCLIVPTS